MFQANRLDSQVTSTKSDVSTVLSLQYDAMILGRSCRLHLTVHFVSIIKSLCYGKLDFG